MSKKSLIFKTYCAKPLRSVVNIRPDAARALARALEALETAMESEGKKMGRNQDKGFRRQGWIRIGLIIAFLGGLALAIYLTESPQIITQLPEATETTVAGE
ncbi:MAG: hypothetical protein OXN21_04475 [Chloroflexota bacterium]|nr:hypothetical protein [Chloroflexota bacterium]